MAPRPPPGPFRAQVERRSATLLVVLSRQPRWVLPLMTVVLFGGAVLLPAAVGAVCLLLLLVLLGWLTYVSWPALDGTGRALRCAVLVLLLVLGAPALG